jgi:hypothetical protein
MPPGCGFVQTFPQISPQPGHVHIAGQNVTILLTLTPMSRQLLTQARTVAARGEHQFSVILSHAACDLHTEEALDNLLRCKYSESAIAELLRSFLGRSVCLDDERVRKVYGVLTGDYPAGHKKLRKKPATWWKEWDASRTLRHEVAHAGKQVSREQAASSIESAEAYIQHVSMQVEQSTRSGAPSKSQPTP